MIGEFVTQQAVTEVNGARKEVDHDRQTHLVGYQGQIRFDPALRGLRPKAGRPGPRPPLLVYDSAPGIEERGQKGPVHRHYLPGSTGPCSSQGDVYGRIRFDGNAPAKSVSDQIIWPGRL